MSTKVQRHTFDDIDALGEHLAGFSIEPIQLSSGPLDVRLSTLLLGDIVVSAITCNRVVSDRTLIDPSWLHVIVLLAPQVWNGFEAQPSHLVLLAPGTEHRDVVPAGFRCVEFAIPVETVGRMGLDAWLERRGGDAVLPLSRSTARAAATWVHEIVRPLATDEPLFSSGLAMTALRERAIQLLRHLFATTTPDGTSLAAERMVRRMPRYDLARAALDLIDRTDPESEASVARIAERLRVTPRAIEYAFRDSIGTTPARYLLSRRLHEARRRLREDRTTVTEAALAAGFEHFGRFSGHYRKLFGELPSQTLRRATKARPLNVG